MKNYYLKDGNKERGPFVLDDLKYQRIRKTTQVKIDNGDWHLLLENSDLRSLLDLKKDNSIGESTVGKSKTIVRNNNPQQVNKRITMIIAIVMLMISIAVGIGMFLVAK